MKRYLFPAISAVLFDIVSVIAIVFWKNTVAI